MITIETEPSRTPEETEAEDVHKVKAATSDDLVGIGYCSTARVYTTTVNTLKALNDFEGYKVTYAVYSQGTARIVDGPRGVEEGGSLTFGVKTQVGYDIQSVSANGEILEAGAPGDSADPDSADPGNLAEDISWFTIEDVTDELEIEVYTTETDEHPEFSDTIVVNDGMIINLYAPEGVLPKGVTASAERVDSALEDSIRENAQEAASEEGKQVSSVAAYDINLWLGSQKLDAGIWNQEGAVTVTFSGVPVEEASQTAEEMSIVHVETEAADVKALEEVRDAVDVSGGRAVDALSFEAEHFSIYAVISKENITRTTVEVSKDETFRVKADRRYGGSWFVSDPRVVSIQNVKDINENGKWYSAADVKALKAGKKASIWYGNVVHNDYFNIIVNEAANQFHFKFNQDSSNISLWYSINGGGLLEMERGQVLQTDRTDMVSFYVKPATGYVTPTTFEHRNGRSEAELAKARFGEGIYVDIADAPSTISTEHTSRDFSDANAEAVSMGCTNQFHYSYRDDAYQYREFKIQATPAKIKVKYDGNGAEGMAPVDYRTYTHPAIRNGNSYIDIKGSGNLKKNHFDFIGWELAETNVNQAGSKIYQQGDSLFVGDVWKDININPVTYVLTAKWMPKQYTLTTASDANSAIDQGKQYTYDADSLIRVNFTAKQGYRISGVAVDGVHLSGKALNEAVQNGWVEVDCKQDHYVSVTSVRTEYNLITRAENADITKGTKYSYSDTDTLDVKFKADKGYSVTGITVDGKSFTKDEIQAILAEPDQQGYSHITLDRKQDHTVFVKADKTLYTLTARADENSWINPQTKSYEYKEFIMYKVKFGAKKGYQIQNIIVDEKELSGFEKTAAIAAGAYLFDYKSSHTIEVTTRINSYHLTTYSDHNSWITPSMDFTYDGTEKLKVEFGAKEGCSISGIWVDLHQYRGDELKEAVSRGYIEVDRDRDHIVSVTGKINEYKLTVGADENSRITEPKQEVTTFTYDSDKCLVVKFKANTGYRVSKVIVDDVSLEGAELLKALASHSVSVDRKGDHSVFVETSPMEYALTTGADLHSRITYPQDRIYTYSYDPEASIEVTFEAKTGYGISGVFVDARPLKGQELQDAIEAGSVRVDRKECHSVYVTSEAKRYTLITDSDEHSSISQGGSYGYDAIRPMLVRFRADTGYTISSITVDGQSLQGAEFERAAALGYVSLSRTRDHEVTVTSRIRQDLEYTVNYFFENDRGDFRIDRQYEHAQHVTNAEYGSDIVFDKTPALDKNGHHYALDHIDGDGKKVSLITLDNVVNVYYGIDEKGETNPEDSGKPTNPDGIPDRYQVTFTYRAGANGAMTGTVMEVATRRDSAGELSLYAPVRPTADGVEYLADDGFTFNNWKSSQPGYKTLIPNYVFDDTDDIAAHKFYCDTVFTANFLDNKNIHYDVEFYMQSQGRYQFRPTYTDSRNDVPLHGMAKVTEQDLADKVESECTYVLDTSRRNITEAKVKEDGSTTLKLYFKQQFTVTYKPGSQGAFTEQSKSDYKYNDRLERFIGEKTPIDETMRFAGWMGMDGTVLQESQLPDTVTKNMIYTAVFEENTVKSGFFVRKDKAARPDGNVPDPSYNYALFGEGFLHANPVMVPAPEGELNQSSEAVLERIAQWPENETFTMDGKTYSMDDIIWYRIQYEEGDPYEWHVDGELKHSIAVVFDLKGGTLNDSTDPLLTYSLQKYGVITDNLIPSLEGSAFSGWRVVESQDTGFKTDQLYQAPDINNHEFTGSVTFEAVWDINMYTVNVEMADKEFPANILDRKLLEQVPFGTDPEADGRLNGLIPESIDGADGNHYIYTGTLRKSYEPVQGVRENGTITVYYMTDNDGPDKKPDGIPDAYEIQFIFESSNEQQGRIRNNGTGAYGTVTEWKSLVELDSEGRIVIGADGEPVFWEDGVSPEGAVTAEANSGYALSGWTALMDDINSSFDDLNEIRSNKYEHDVVFAAQWSAAGGNPPDTGGNSRPGSSSGSSSSGSGSGRRYVSTNGGPGAVTLEETQVPLAEAPMTVIDDGEIPLAPLPKTGNILDRMSLTFLLSGIVLTLSVFDRRRHIK